MSRFDHTPSNPQDQFTEQLSTLLARTADSARPNPNLARLLRQRLTSAETPIRPRESFSFSRPSLAPIGSVALVALLLAAFGWALIGHGMLGFKSLLGGGRQGTAPVATATAAPLYVPPCDPAQQQHYPSIALTANPTDHSIAVGASASDKGVTVTIQRVYADATQTIITYTTSPNGYSAFNDGLYDASGARYGAFSGGGGRRSNGQFMNMEVFHPLPQSELGSPQQLTLRITKLMGQTSGSEGSPAPVVNGAWNIPFTVTPPAGTAIPLSLPAQTHDGITIQLEELDIAPAGGGLDGQSGGVRVRYRISNLPATTALSTMMEYPTYFATASTSSASAPLGVACHNLLTLQLANGQTTIPGAIALTTPIEPGAANAMTGVVGADGSAEVEAVFFAPAPQGSGAITINQVAIGELRDGTLTYTRIAQGPWVFTAPLR